MKTVSNALNHNVLYKQTLQNTPVQKKTDAAACLRFASKYLVKRIKY